MLIAAGQLKIYIKLVFPATPAKQCLQSDKGIEYFGSVRQTEDGIPCQKWADQTPHSHSYTFISDQENFCRNAGAGEKKPWCYTTNPDKRWDYCDIPFC